MTDLFLKENKIKYIDKVIEFCFMGLLIILPIAHTTTIRAIFIWLAVLLWLARTFSNNDCGLRKTPLDIPFLLFLITIIISLFTSLKFSTSIRELRGEFITYMLLFYMVTNSINKEDRIQKLVVVLLAGSFFMAVYAIIDYFSHTSNLFDIAYRTGSLHQGYEAYAQYIIMVIPFNILAFYYRGALTDRILLALLLVLNIFALYLTHTRGAFVALYLEFTLLAVIVIKNNIRRFGAVAGLILITMLLVYSMPQKVLWHGGKGLDLETSNPRNTVETRLIVWKNTVEKLVEDPFSPAGYGEVNFQRRFPGKEFLGFTQAHNTFINTAVQLGVQGLIALLLIIYSVLNICWSIWKKEGARFQKFFALSVFIMTIGFFTANQFAEFYKDDTALLFWLFAGLCTSIYTEPSKC